MFENVKLNGPAVAVPKPGRIRNPMNWQRPDLSPNDRIMVTHTNGAEMVARVKRCDYYDARTPNHHDGRWIVQYKVDDDNVDPDINGAESTSWADEVHPIAYAVHVHGVTIMVIDNEKRAMEYVTNANKKVQDDIELDIGSLIQDRPDWSEDDINQYRAERHSTELYRLKDIMLVPEWAGLPSVEG